MKPSARIFHLINITRARAKAAALLLLIGTTATAQPLLPVPQGVAMKAPKTATLQPRKAQGLSGNLRPVGYSTTDQVDVTGGFGMVVTASVGAVLDSDMLEAYQGCKIVGVRFALNKSIGRKRAFVYSLDDNRLTLLHEQNQRTYEGWNNVVFNGFEKEISGDETLFFGFDYEETQEMVDADDGYLCGVGNDRENGFVALADFGQGTNLYSLSAMGCLCVQLIVDVSNLPAKKLDFYWTDTGFRYKRQGERVDMLTSFINSGRDTVFAARLLCHVDSDLMIDTLLTDTVLPGATEYVSLVLNVPQDYPIGSHELAFSFGEVDGDAEAGAISGIFSTAFVVYNESLKRHKVYLESYTDADNYVSSQQNSMLTSLSAYYSEILSVVSIHRPGTALAIPEAAYLDTLYAYTHPCFTSNRSYFPGEEYIAYDMNSYYDQVGVPFTVAIAGGVVEQDYDSPAFANVGLGGLYDPDTRRLSITASGKTLAEARQMFGELALTLMIVENQVASPQQVISGRTGAPVVSNAYKHDNVLRQFITRPVGDRLTLNGDSFEASYELVLPDGLNAANTRVVALVTKAADSVTDENVMGMDVLDCDDIRLSDIQPDPDGITDVTAPDIPQCYSLSGQRTGKDARGLVIERNGNRVRKVMRR